MAPPYPSIMIWTIKLESSIPKDVKLLIVISALCTQMTFLISFGFFFSIINKKKYFIHLQHVWWMVIKFYLKFETYLSVTINLSRISWWVCVVMEARYLSMCYFVISNFLNYIYLLIIFLLLYFFWYNTFFLQIKIYK